MAGYYSIIFFIGLLISLIYLLSIKSKSLRRNDDKIPLEDPKTCSVIIPARNEQDNILKLATKLMRQTVKIDEIIIVNDNSSDRTKEVASELEKKHSNLKLINLMSEPPEGWVGKSWAIWNGIQASQCDLLILLDADVEPGEEAVEALFCMHKKHGGLISVWPHQRFEKLYEHIGLVANLLTVFASNTFGFLGRVPSGCFGPVIVTSKSDYTMTGGHEAIKNELLDDIKLARLYLKHGINIRNYLGGEIISFRMYPNGIGHLFEGISKNISLGAHTVSCLEFIIAFIWFAAMLASVQYIPSILNIYRYFLYVIVIYVLSRAIGDYKIYDALLYPVHFILTLIIFIFSFYKGIFRKKVNWKGRQISVK